MGLVRFRPRVSGAAQTALAEAVHTHLHMLNAARENAAEARQVHGDALGVQAVHAAALAAVEVRMRIVAVIGREAVEKGPPSAAEAFHDLFLN